MNMLCLCLQVRVDRDDGGGDGAVAVRGRGLQLDLDGGLRLLAAPPARPGRRLQGHLLPLRPRRGRRIRQRQSQGGQETARSCCLNLNTHFA